MNREASAIAGAVFIVAGFLFALVGLELVYRKLRPDDRFNFFGTMIVGGGLIGLGWWLIS